MSEKRRGLLAAATAALVVVVAAGCGGSTGNKAGGGIGAPGAKLVTADALAYVSIDSDLSSDRWQQLNDLLQKFPIRDRLMQELKDALAKKDVNYERDVKPALGDELDVAAAPGASSQEEPSYVVLTKPDSLAAAKALVDKLDSGPPAPATRVVDGWFVVAEKPAMLDRVLKGSGDALADNATFKDAFGALPDDALAKVYANGPQLTKLFTSLSGATTASFASSPEPKLDWITADLVAKDNGLRLDAHVKSPNGSDFTGAPYESKLLSGVPADAIAFLDFHGTNAQNQLSRLRQNPMVAAALAEIERQLGMSLDRVFALFEHEVGFYVRRGPGLPEFSLALEAPDTQGALTTVDRLAARIAEYAHAQIGTEHVGGLEVKTLNLGPVTVRWAGFDGRVLITTAPTGIDDYRSNGDKLGDASAYKDALSAAGAPDKNLGLIYLNLADGTQLIKSYLGISGEKVPPDVAENLKPLQSFVAYGSQDGDLTNVAAFLAIK